VVLDEKHTIEIFGKTVPQIIDEIVEKHPTPASLLTSSLLLTYEEEAAFDAMQGMMWPSLFVAGLHGKYHELKENAGDIIARIQFPDDKHIQLTFQME